MTGHFTTLDKCERWDHIDRPLEFYRVPYSMCIPYTDDAPLTPARKGYSYRTYKLQSIDYARGLAEYLEVYKG